MTLPFRYLVALLLLIACNGTSNKLPAEAWGVDDYAKAGLHIDRAWAPDDYVTAQQVLEKVTAGHRERLPRFHGARSGAVFAKLITDLPDDSAEPVATRFVAHTTRLGAINAIAKLYLPNQMDTPPREWIELLGADLREAALLVRDTDAFMASLGPDDPQHAARLEGLDQMATGDGLMLIGALAVADQLRVPEADRVVMLEYVTAALPALFPRAKPETQQQIREALAKEAAAFPAGPLKAAAAAAEQALPK